MKNYKDMADAVFRRRDEYVASVKRKKKIALNASISLCSICLAVLGAFGIWQSGVLTPDPNVIGTKPQSYTEPTEDTLHSLGGNATSEGENSEHTELVSGNSKPQSSTGNITPNESNKTQSTDPNENQNKPQVKPTLPALPTLPIGPNLPTLPILPTLPKPPSVQPDVPPAGDGIPSPKPPVVLPTDPIEVPDATSSIDGTESTEGNVPTQPATVEPTWAPSASPDTNARPDEATEPTEKPPVDSPDCPARPDEPTTDVFTEPLCTDPSDPCEEPTERPIEVTIPAAPETQAPMPPTEALPPDIPPTSVEVNRAVGRVLDQYGNPVKGAVVKVYYNGEVEDTYTTNSNGDYYLAKFRAPATIKVYSVPSGYTLSGITTRVSKGYNYIDLTCNKK